MRDVIVAAVFVVGQVLTGEDAAVRWIDSIVTLDRASPAPRSTTVLHVLRQDYERLETNKSVIGTPLVIGSRSFAHGLGTHSVGHIRVEAQAPITRFSAWLGVDKNERTAANAGSVVFSLGTGDRVLYRSPVKRGGEEPERVEIVLAGPGAAAGPVTTLDLRVEDAGDGSSCDHADWAEATITLASGENLRLDTLPIERPAAGTRYPFSFVFDGKASDELLPAWKPERRVSKLDANRERILTSWTDAATGLSVQQTAIRFLDFPALEWILHFENSGAKDTPIIENIQAASLVFSTPRETGNSPYLLHRTNGAPADPTDFEVSRVSLDAGRSVALGAGGGRSSNRDFPFFRIDTGAGAVVVAVGWSGQWQARLTCIDGTQLTLTAGMEKTRFVLHAGERVRSPRILVLYEDGDPEESNARFRQLIYTHYAARRAGTTPLPILFCNTCFTRGGGWLNECTAENQISLIKAYAPLGVEALITDAGWFEGGWPAGAGTWTPRRDAYPAGMRPIAAAALAHSMVYGLWFEPERVVASTEFHRRHPEWCLTDGQPAQLTFLANFALPEVREHFFSIVAGFMALPGFRVYRQDFNMDPLPYWRHSDTPDRQGITEIMYLEGLYDYWDRLAAAWPDSLREECASGGRRIDLETVMRFHIHQKTDYWFDDNVDQASLFGLSQFLPNNVFVAHLNRLDTYSFHSTLASSLCLGWIADAPNFDLARASKLVATYREARPLLTGAWYPLLPYSRRPTDWAAVQFHRPDLGRGAILVFRRAASAYRTIEVALRGLSAERTYELIFTESGRTLRARGAELVTRFEVTLPKRRSSELIVYKEIDRE